MSAPDILAIMSKRWNRDPASQIAGGGHAGVAAALWSGGFAGTDDVEAEPNSAYHILCVALEQPRTDVFVDGRRVFGGVAPRHSCQLMTLGTRPRAVFYERHSTLHIYVPSSLVDRSIETAGLPVEKGAIELVDPRCTLDPFIERIGREMLAEMRQDQPLSRLRVDALGQDLVIQLLRRHSNLKGTNALGRDPVRGGLASWQLRRVDTYLAEHLGSDLGLDDLASTVSLSPLYFAKAFKRATGTAPHQYLVRQRVERAKELLTDTDLPLAEIALACGFADQSHLTNTFKRLVGVTPAAYRKAM